MARFDNLPTLSYDEFLKRKDAVRQTVSDELGKPLEELPELVYGQDFNTYMSKCGAGASQEVGIPQLPPAVIVPPPKPIQPMQPEVMTPSQQVTQQQLETRGLAEGKTLPFQTAPTRLGSETQGQYQQRLTEWQKQQGIIKEFPPGAEVSGRKEPFAFAEEAAPGAFERQERDFTSEADKLREANPQLTDNQIITQLSGKYPEFQFTKDKTGALLGRQRFSEQERRIQEQFEKGVTEQVVPPEIPRLERIEPKYNWEKQGLITPPSVQSDVFQTITKPEDASKVFDRIRASTTIEGGADEIIRIMERNYPKWQFTFDATTNKLSAGEKAGYDSPIEGMTTYQGRKKETDRLLEYEQALAKSGQVPSPEHTIALAISQGIPLSQVFGQQGYISPPEIEQKLLWRDRPPNFFAPVPDVWQKNMAGIEAPRQNLAPKAGTWMPSQEWIESFYKGDGNRKEEAIEWDSKGKETLKVKAVWGRTQSVPKEWLMHNIPYALWTPNNIIIKAADETEFAQIITRIMDYGLPDITAIGIPYATPRQIPTDDLIYNIARNEEAGFTQAVINSLQSLIDRGQLTQEDLAAYKADRLSLPDILEKVGAEPQTQPSNPVPQTITTRDFLSDYEVTEPVAAEPGEEPIVKILPDGWIPQANGDVVVDNGWKVTVDKRYISPDGNEYQFKDIANNEKLLKQFSVNLFSVFELSEITEKAENDPEGFVKQMQEAGDSVEARALIVQMGIPFDFIKTIFPSGVPTVGELATRSIESAKQSTEQDQALLADLVKDFSKEKLGTYLLSHTIQTFVTTPLSIVATAFSPLYYVNTPWRIATLAGALKGNREYLTPHDLAFLKSLEDASNKYGWGAYFSEEVNTAWEKWANPLEGEKSGLVDDYAVKFLGEWLNPAYFIPVGGAAVKGAKLVSKIPLLGKASARMAAAVIATEAGLMLPITAVGGLGVRGVQRLAGMMSEGMVNQMLKRAEARVSVLKLPTNDEYIGGLIVPNWQKTVLNTAAKVSPNVRGLQTATLGWRMSLKAHSTAAYDVAGTSYMIKTQVGQTGLDVARIEVASMRGILPNATKEFAADQYGLSQKMIDRLKPDYKAIYDRNKPKIADLARRISATADDEAGIALRRELQSEYSKLINEMPAGTIDHIFTNPSMYNWNGFEKGEAYVREYHEIVKGIRKLMEDEGTLPMIKGIDDELIEMPLKDWWYHRKAEGFFEEGAELPTIIAGLKSNYSRGRKFESQAEGIGYRVKYSNNPEESLSDFIRQSFSKIGDKRFINYSEKYDFARTLKELIAKERPELFETVDGKLVWKAELLGEEKVDAAYASGIVNRMVRGEKTVEQTMRAIERRFPDIGRRLRELNVVADSGEANLRNILWETKVQNDALTAQMKAKGTEAEVPVKGRYADIPDDEKIREALKEMDYYSRAALKENIKLRTQEIGALKANLVQEDLENAYLGFKRMLRVMDDYDEAVMMDEIILSAEEAEVNALKFAEGKGGAEVSIQTDMFGYPRQVFPESKGKAYQISKDDYTKLIEAREKAGLPPPSDVVVKPKMEGVPGFEKETYYKIEPEKPLSQAERAKKLDEIRKELVDITKERKAAFSAAERAKLKAQEQFKGTEEWVSMAQSHGFTSGRYFKREFVDDFNKFFGGEAGNNILQPIAQASGILGIMRATLDYSGMMIQGLPSFGYALTHMLAPHSASMRVAGAKMMGEWFKAFGYMVRSPWDTSVFYKLMQKEESLSLSRAMSGGMSRSVDIFPQITGNKSIMDKIERGIVEFTPYERAQIAFLVGGEHVRNTFWDIMSKKLSPERMVEYARFLDRMTGLLDAKAIGLPKTIQQIERAFIFFAPNYKRASWSIVADIFRGGFTGAEARKALGGLIAAAGVFIASTRYSIALLEGKTQEQALDSIEEGFGWTTNILHPEQKNWAITPDFMSITIGGTRLGVGGAFYGILRFASDILSVLQQVGDKEIVDLTKIRKFGTWNRDNPFLSYFFSGSSMVTQITNTLSSRRNWMGEPLETWQDYLKYVATLAEPFAFEDGVNQFIPFMRNDWEIPETTVDKILRPLGSTFGLRVAGVSEWKQFYNEAKKYTNTIPESVLAKYIPDKKQRDIAVASQKEGKFGWGEMPEALQLQLRMANPELDKLYVEAQAGSAMRQSPLWKEWTELVDYEQEAYYKRGEYELKRMRAGEISRREMRINWSDAGKNYGVSLSFLEKNPHFDEIYDYFTAKESKGIKYDWNISLLTQKYQQILFTDYEDENGIMDWDKRDAAIDGFIKNYGKKTYDLIRQSFATQKILGGMNPVFAQMSDDKEQLKTFWDIGRVEEKDLIKRLELIKRLNPLQAKATPEFKELSKKNTEARIQYRMQNPELDAKLALWGYYNTVRTERAYQLLKYNAARLNIPIEDVKVAGK